jgi:hypothetical protein
MNLLTDKYNTRTQTLTLKPQHYLLVLLVTICLTGNSQQEELPFHRGEYLKYRVYYDSWATAWMTAGFAVMEIDPEWQTVGGREAYHIRVDGYSVGIFTLFYKVRDQFESFVDREELVSLKFVRRTQEGRYKRNDDVLFDHQNLKAHSTRMVNDITPGVQDMISSFYHMRTWDFDTAEVNDEYFMDFFLDDSLYRSKIVFLGRDTIKSELGEFRCLKFKPQVAQGEIFQEPYPAEIWVTDDRNKVPVLINSAVFIGSVKVELIEHRGLKWPLGD